MYYAKLSSGVLNYAPKDYITDDMRVIVNFDTNQEKLMEYGYKQVIDNKPEYNVDTQCLVINGYSENDSTITIEYGIIDITPELTIEEKIDSLQIALNNITKQMDDILKTQSDYNEVFESIANNRDGLIELLNK